VKNYYHFGDILWPVTKLLILKDLASIIIFLAGYYLLLAKKKGL